MITAEYDADGNWLFDHLLHKMHEEIGRGKKRGKWLENMTAWNYHPEFLLARHVTSRPDGVWVIDSSEVRTFTLSMPMSPEDMKKAPTGQLIKYFDQALAMREGFIEWLKEIPQVVDESNRRIRWPKQLDFTYSGSGQQIEIKLTAHVVEIC